MSSNKDRQGGFGAAIPSRLELSPERRKHEAARIKAEERRWAAKSGPVTTTYRCICPGENCQAHE